MNKKERERLADFILDVEDFIVKTKYLCDASTPLHGHKSVIDAKKRFVDGDDVETNEAVMFCTKCGGSGDGRINLENKVTT